MITASIRFIRNNEQYTSYAVKNIVHGELQKKVCETINRHLNILMNDFNPKTYSYIVENDHQVWGCHILSQTDEYIHLEIIAKTDIFFEDQEWCKLNCSGKYHINYQIVSFSNEQDAVLYKLLRL